MRHVSIMLVLVFLATAGWTQVLPKPQIASAEGKPAPNFSLRDQDGRTVRLSSLRGQRVLLVFFRGTWWPYCTGQLREFAQHSKDFNELKIRVLCISADDREKSKRFWEKELGRKFAVLSDPDAKVIREYGILDEGENIALDTTLLIGPDGREKWRYVSATLPDLPTAEQTLRHVRQSLQASSRPTK